MTQTPGKRPARRPGVRDGAERPFAARMGGGDKEKGQRGMRNARPKGRAF